MAPSSFPPLRNLILVLGDQLDPESSAFDGFDPKLDAVWMAEVSEEAEHVWSHKVRIAYFISAMRHFRERLRRKRIRLFYHELGPTEEQSGFADRLEKTVRESHPQALIIAEPGEWRVRESLLRTAKRLSVPLDIRPDRHFICSTEEFAHHARGRKQLRMEFFYREMRRKTGVLMTGGTPVGDRWNFDAENRDSFGKEGPGPMPEPTGFLPDKTTSEVLNLVRERFPHHPGSLDRFDWPMTKKDAERCVEDFIEHRLSRFGPYQDAMWTSQPFLYHSRLSAALNVKLLDPLDVIRKIEAARADRRRKIPLASAEGFIRQILGWREYVRGVYWHHMPEYLEMNALEAGQDLPGFYWTAETDMNCLREAIGQTLDYGYAHHIQRLMVTGLFALLLGVRPQEVHRWYLAVYLDAVEWVEVPNTLGMSQFADGGIMASKPYAATGKYIHRMSNYCDECRYDPDQRSGGSACPFTLLYWDFLLRNEKRLAGNPRMKLQLRNLGGLAPAERRQLRRRAGGLRRDITAA
jgi:deoxyribodipyrimidine photolyase-related protein